MTTPATPLTANEIAAWRDIATDEPTKGWQPTAVMRLIATIEQQAEQIERHLAIFRRVRNRFELNGEPPYSDLFKDIRKVLAATEPVNDKR